MNFDLTDTQQTVREKAETFATATRTTERGDTVAIGTRILEVAE